MAEKASKKNRVSVVQKNENVKRALLLGDQAELQRASEELLVAIADSVNSVEKEIDDWLKDAANDR